jgi:hypothetical protein
VNTGYVIWFAVLVVVAGATLLWLAIGVVPEIPPDPGPEPVPGVTEGTPPAGVTGTAGIATPPSEPVPGPGSEPVPGPGSGPRPASEAAGEDGIAGPS